ncbi:MAG: DNA-binding response regulator [Bacteroidetes bacterium GWF2_33_16]|nr:MAG: DNA-binding response regulator [Bacteroidetes bacterium GWE2_32_14]OFY03361.1 MAG: DNA-binding response regulator [Bacteroidetes bacterium GWF2_33_16]
MNARCIIIDDEPLAIKVIKSHVSKFDFIELVAECKNALQAVDILRNENIDLMFLDINMPKVTGLDFLKSIPHPPYVIITTAYREYALEGFDLNVVDYLLKPISFDRFLKAINKFCERQEKSKSKDPQEITKKENLPIIHIQDGKTIFKIHLDKILYFEGFGEYVKVHTIEKTYLSRKPMHEYEKVLPNNQFIRTHKSFIVSLSQISGFTTSTVIINGKEIPIGRTFKDSVLESLDYPKENLIADN